MKNILLIAGMLASTAPAFSQYTVQGKIDNFAGTVFMTTVKAGGSTDTICSAVTTDGTFNFKGASAPLSNVAELHAIGTRINIPVFIENGYNYQVTTTTEKNADYNVSGGGSLQQCASEFHNIKKFANNWRDSITDDFKKQYDITDPFWRIQLRGALEKVNAKYEQLEDSLLQKFDNVVSAYTVASRLRKLTLDKTIHHKYDLLGNDARETVYGHTIKPFADKISRIVVGATAPDFEMQAPDGKTISLYGVKAKVKILDFWASWCGPCRAENPNMRNIYKNFHDKGLEILSISLDSDKEAWIKAIADDEMTWKHACELGSGKIVKDVYYIFAIPHIFVLDENNKIISEGMRGEELEKFIEQQFK